MDTHLLLQNKKRLYMLVRYPDRFHLITVNSKLDEHNEEQLLSGPCSDAAMDEMGLTFETLRPSDLRGVAIGGCRAGDLIVLYTKSDKRKFQLSDDYFEEDLEAVFTGIERFLAPENKKSSSRQPDWRIGMQTESMGQITHSIGIVLNVAGWLCLAAMFFGRLSTFWSVFCLSVIAVSLGLHLIYPQYFSVMDREDYKKAGYTAKVSHIGTAISLSAVTLVLRTLNDFDILNWKTLLISGVLVGIVISVLMYIRSTEVRVDPMLAISVVLLALLCSWAIVGQLNHLFNFHSEAPQPYTITYMERETNRKGPDSCYCIVFAEDGTKIKVPVSSRAYSRLRPGDSIPVYRGEGAFGIEYAYYAGSS